MSTQLKKNPRKIKIKSTEILSKWKNFYDFEKFSSAIFLIPWRLLYKNKILDGRGLEENY